MDISFIGQALELATTLRKLVGRNREALMKIDELELALSDVKRRYSALEDEVVELEKEARQLRQHHLEREQYEEKRLPSGAWVITERPAQRGAVDPGYREKHFCAHCFGNGQRCILQPVFGSTAPLARLKCPGCGNEIATDPPPRGCHEFFDGPGAW